MIGISVPSDQKFGLTTMSQFGGAGCKTMAAVTTNSHLVLQLMHCYKNVGHREVVLLNESCKTIAVSSHEWNIRSFRPKIWQQCPSLAVVGAKQ